MEKLRAGQFLILGFQGETAPKWIKDFEKKWGLGGVIYFDYDVGKKKYERNVSSPEQVKHLSDEFARMNSRPLVVVDQEGGKVRRLKESKGFEYLSSHKQFNLLEVTEKEKQLRVSFSQLKSLGIHFNLAPVVDLDLNPSNPDLGAVERCFSPHAADVLKNARLFGKVAKEVGLGLCLKHYPGMGGAKTNSHEELTDISSCTSVEQEEIFYSLIPDIPGSAVLVSHGLIKQWDEKNPASLSPFAIERLRARNKEVLIFSDDLQMKGLQAFCSTQEAVLKGLKAGTDLMIIGNNLLSEEDQSEEIAEAVEQAIENDKAFREMLNGSSARILARKNWAYQS